MNEQHSAGSTDPGNRYANCLQGLAPRAIESPASFVHWLSILPPDTTFGRGICECPLAKFSGHSVGWLSYGNTWLPDWAVTFVDIFLRKKGPKTASRALEIMGNIHV